MLDGAVTAGGVAGGAAFLPEESSGNFVRFEAGRQASGHILDVGATTAWEDIAAVELTSAATLAAGALAIAAALSF